MSISIPEWASEVVRYLDEKKLPDTKEEARRVRRKAERFLLIDGVLYKRGSSVPLLRCIFTQKTQYVLEEIHEEICGNHSGGKSLTRKAMREGYYWPNALRDA